MKKEIVLALSAFSFALLLSEATEIITTDLIVEGETELQSNTEIKGDLKVTGPDSEMLFGTDGLLTIQSSLYSGNVGVFWDPQRMAFRVGRSTGTEWAIPWALYSAGIGYNVKPTGTHSVALNQSTIAGGGSSLATGKNTLAGGDASVTMGISTQAQSFASVVIGSYNELLGGQHHQWIASDPLFVIGNGSAWNDRRNAVTVLKNGRTGIGTSTPQATLDVQGDAHFSGEVLINHIPPQGDILMGQFGN